MTGGGWEVNVRVLGKGLELLSANGGWFEINQLLFADDTALVVESEKLCKLVSLVEYVKEESCSIAQDTLQRSPSSIPLIHHMRISIHHNIFF